MLREKDMNYSELLNEEQLKAVTTESKYTKVIAGAGPFLGFSTSIIRIN